MSPHASDRDLRRRDWMVAAQAGDRVAYQALLKDCVDTIRTVARSKRVPADHLDDVVQETLITIHRVRQTYDPARSFSAWLAAIATHRSIDVMRRYQRHASRELNKEDDYDGFEDQAPDALSGVDRAQQAAAVRRAIADLPPGQREAVERLALGEQSLAEASAVTGRTTSALKVNLHRALNNLRKTMRGDGTP